MYFDVHNPEDTDCNESRDKPFISKSAAVVFVFLARAFAKNRPNPRLGCGYRTDEGLEAIGATASAKENAIVIRATLRKFKGFRAGRSATTARHTSPVLVSGNKLAMQVDRKDYKAGPAPDRPPMPQSTSHVTMWGRHGQRTGRHQIEATALRRTTCAESA
ncbi:hypothetical protein ACFIOY_35385 [Bradyrhizobium sp. TZ2]